MSVCERDLVNRFVLILSQVEYQESFRLVNYEELTEPGHELAISLRVVIVAEEQRAPFDLHNRALAHVVPNSYRG
jgi:hypothetical protein